MASSLRASTGLRIAPFNRTGRGEQKSSSLLIISMFRGASENNRRERKTMGGTRAVIAVLILALGVLSICSWEAQGAGPQLYTAPSSSNIPVYYLAVHPLYNPSKLMEAYQPVVDYLNGGIKEVRFKLEASRDYAKFEEKYRARKPEFLLANPWQTLQAMEVGYHVIAMAGDSNDFKGIFLVRKDSGIRRPADLKGRAVSYPSPTALAACVMPQYFLHEHGIDINADVENKYVGSQDSSIMNVYLGLTAAGASWPPPWRAFQKEHPGEAAELEVVWETEPLVNNSVMARDDIPAEIRDIVRTLLLELGGTVEGRAILAGMETARFLAATDADYEIVRRYVVHFEQVVRPVEKK